MPNSSCCRTHNPRGRRKRRGEEEEEEEEEPSRIDEPIQRRDCGSDMYISPVRFSSLSPDNKIGNMTTKRETLDRLVSFVLLPFYFSRVPFFKEAKRRERPTGSNHKYSIGASGFPLIFSKMPTGLDQRRMIIDRRNNKRRWNPQRRRLVVPDAAHLVRNLFISLDYKAGFPTGFPITKSIPAQYFC